MENLIEHLLKSKSRVNQLSIEINNDFDQAQIYRHNLNQTNERKTYKNRNLKLATKSMYDIIYEYVIPKWKKYLKSKSERRISTQIKPRKDTLWKKILRDVREFYSKSDFIS